ncbi:MAG: hypothetical protein H0T11_07155, partial [Chthoniobacterales bacterium]|nr:hypothetical protein [Chthoniobacterales bacterium]
MARQSSLLRLISRVFVKLLMVEGGYLKKKLLLQPVVHGPEERLTFGTDVDLNDTVFNTKSGTITV